jgi:hypothetical protein
VRNWVEIFGASREKRGNDRQNESGVFHSYAILQRQQAPAG